MFYELNDHIKNVSLIPYDNFVPINPYPIIKKQGKVFYRQEHPSGESTTTECGVIIINYLQ